MDPATGIQPKRKLISMSKYHNAISGQDIIDWLMIQCRFLVKDEALRLAQEMIDSGYLISTDLADKFELLLSQYVLQVFFVCI